MSKELENFVAAHMFIMKKVAEFHDGMEDSRRDLTDAFEKSGLPGDYWQDMIPQMEALLGSPIASWHAGHLSKLKGETLPNWKKRDAYIGGFSATQRLEKLHSKAADTLAQMKYALVRDTLTQHAQLYDTEVQQKMASFLSEMYDKAKSNPLAFMENLANRKFAVNMLNITVRPSAQWARIDKTTELVCQLVNLTYLDIQNALHSDNELDKNNALPSTTDSISVQ